MGVQQLLLEIMLAMWVTEASLGKAASLAKANCQDICGNVTIPYPFGIGGACSGHESYIITCNTSFTPPRPFLTSVNLEVLEISVNGTVRVNSPIITSNCPNRDNGRSVNLWNSLFSFSDTYNRFTAIGCNNLALISQSNVIIGGCMSFCSFELLEGLDIQSCYGINCCQNQIPPFLKCVNVSHRSTHDYSSAQEDCQYAFIVDQDWFSSLTTMNHVKDMQHVPAVLDWRTTGNCNTFGDYTITMNSSLSLCSSHAFCSERRLCTCLPNYGGNPYLPRGCQAIDQGSNREWIIFVGFGAGLLLLVLVPWWLKKVIEATKKNMLKEKFFKRNGGMLLKQQLSSGECNIEKTKLFTTKELEKATDHYNENLILGRGGQGTVYKGMLIDGRIVAIKKSKIEDEGKLEHFINEVVILSQISHRNVVKLHGCCLETEVPLLVYEFIPNGTLYQYIHDNNEEFPLTWEIRLQVAKEIAAAVSYLHTAASIPIYHRDIKSTNILLDKTYRAKVADFGTSRSIAVDQTHLTTRVQGTFGYLDPEYFRSNQFTEKSDVYSFGVVLVELLTGQKPITSTESDEIIGLGTHFLMEMKENHLFDILDVRVLNEGAEEEIIKFAYLAERCLNVNGSKRPTMKAVAMELGAIRS